MKKLIFLTLVFFLHAPVFSQTVTTTASLLRPTTTLPVTCLPYSVRTNSTGIRICNAAGNGWTYIQGSTSILTAGRLPFVDTGGILSDSANATLSSAGALAVGSTSNGGSALLTLQGYSYNAANGSFGRLLFYGNAHASSSTRQWLFTNASSRFRIIRSVDGVTTPAINSSAVVSSGTEDFSIDENGEVSLRTSASVGTTAEGGSALLTLQGYSANAANGIYGRMILNANANHTSDARRWLITNALTRFRIIRSTNATTTPTINSSGVVTSGTEDFSIDKDGNTTIPSLKITNLAFTATAPTVTSAGTSPSIVANNGTVAFTVNVGTGGTATTIVLGMPTAVAGWICHATNITATAANRADQAVRQTASTTTSVTLQNQTVSTGAALAFTASDVVRCQCTAY